MTLARVVGGVGRTLIGLGVLILLFVAYQLWGTGLQEARAQSALFDELEALLEAEAVDTPATTTTTVAAEPDEEPEPAPTTMGAWAPPPPEGSAVAILRIPTIGLEKAVVEGVSVAALKRGPGRYPETPMPGQEGNAAIAGHRTTYGAPFYRLDELEPGDPILVTTRQGRFEYRVRETKIVHPSQVEVLDPTDDNRLTLTTCHPRFSAAQRLVVVAELIGEAAPAPPPPPDPGPDDAPGEPPAGSDDPVVRHPPAELMGADLSGEAASNGPAIAWGALSALVLLAIWAAGRWWRRWPAYLLGAPVFLVVLFVFFENFARLLPANI